MVHAWRSRHGSRIGYVAHALGRPHMDVFIFVGRGGVCGATTDPAGAKLPDGTGPWRFLKKTKLGQLTGISLLNALREIKMKGYCPIMLENL